MQQWLAKIAATAQARTRPARTNLPPAIWRPSSPSGQERSLGSIRPGILGQLHIFQERQDHGRPGAGNHRGHRLSYTLRTHGRVAHDVGGVVNQSLRIAWTLCLGPDASPPSACARHRIAERRQDFPIVTPAWRGHDAPA
jgi:hypothetical protein